MSAALADNTPAASRLLADVRTLHGHPGARPPAFQRLEAALGRDFADRLVTALVQERRAERSGGYRL